MIIGVGTDLIEIERVRKACEKEAFLTRVYTQEERRQAGERISRLAGDFAVKEAVTKVFGTGFRTFGPQAVEVLRDELGRPYVKLSGEAGALAKRLGVERIHVSISNTKTHALACAVGEGRENAAAGNGKTDEGN